MGQYLISATVSAATYSHNQRISITDRKKEIGFVESYMENIFGTDYIYLK